MKRAERCNLRIIHKHGMNRSNAQAPPLQTHLRHPTGRHGAVLRWPIDELSCALRNAQSPESGIEFRCMGLPCVLVRGHHTRGGKVDEQPVAGEACVLSLLCVFLAKFKLWSKHFL